jgi:hypothetical protein
MPKSEPKRYNPGEGLPTRVPGTSFHELPIPKDTTSKSEIGPEGIKSALESYKTGKETAERGPESSEQGQRDPQNQPAPSQGSNSSSQDGVEI